MARSGLRRSCDTEYEKASSSRLDASSSAVRRFTRRSSSAFMSYSVASACLRWVMSSMLPDRLSSLPWPSKRAPIAISSQRAEALPVPVRTSICIELRRPSSIGSSRASR